MCKDSKDIKDRPHYEFRSGEYGKKDSKSTTESKLKCGQAGIDCLIKK